MSGYEVEVQTALSQAVCPCLTLLVKDLCRGATGVLVRTK